MKIYIASSWKNSTTLLILAKNLREVGHEIDLFCDSSSNRLIFDWRDLVTPDEVIECDVKDFIESPIVLQAFMQDQEMIDWADAVLMVLPCGKSAHLEAGYAKGKGKKLFIYGDMIKGSFDVMYLFADGMFRINEKEEMLKALAEG